MISPRSASSRASGVLECFEDRILPSLFEGPSRTVLVAAHSNTLRALMAHVDGVADDDVPSLHVPNSVPILYRFCEETQKLASSKLSVRTAAPKPYVSNAVISDLLTII